MLIFYHNAMSKKPSSRPLLEHVICWNEGEKMSFSQTISLRQNEMNLNDVFPLITTKGWGWVSSQRCDSFFSSATFPVPDFLLNASIFPFHQIQVSFTFTTQANFPPSEPGKCSGLLRAETRPPNTQSRLSVNL